jgi:hypothetical protein
MFNYCSYMCNSPIIMLFFKCQTMDIWWLCGTFQNRWVSCKFVTNVFFRRVDTVFILIISYRWQHNAVIIFLKKYTILKMANNVEWMKRNFKHELFFHCFRYSSETKYTVFPPLVVLFCFGDISSMCVHCLLLTTPPHGNPVLARLASEFPEWHCDCIPDSVFSLL